MAAKGARAVMLFIVQRADCDTMSLAHDIDPRYAKAMTEARAAGVEVICYKCSLSEENISVTQPLKVV